MNLVNDVNCAWLNDLNNRNQKKELDKDLSCEYLIIGAGFTGLSAARKLATLHPKKNIIIVDAQLAGEGASSRNSGYLVEQHLMMVLLLIKIYQIIKKKLIFINLVLILLKNLLKNIK